MMVENKIVNLFGVSLALYNIFTSEGYTSLIASGLDLVTHGLHVLFEEKDMGLNMATVGVAMNLTCGMGRVGQLLVGRSSFFATALTISDVLIHVNNACVIADENNQAIVL